MSEWDTGFVRRRMSVDGIGAPNQANQNRFDRWLAEHDREVAARALREFRKHVEERRDGASTQLISDCTSFTIGAIDGYLIRQQIERGAGE